MMADLVAQRLLDSEPPPQDDLVEVANSLQRRETDLQTRETTMMTQMQEMMANMMNHNNNNNNNNNRYNRDNRDRGGRFPPGRGRGRYGGGRGNDPQQPQQPRLYCWSHGACAHGSPACDRPAHGHQTTATFANMMNGSVVGCFWLN